MNLCSATGFAVLLAAPAAAQHEMHGGTHQEMEHEAGKSPWSWSVSGLARLVYNHQGGPAGDEVVESTNWNMIGLDRHFESGTLSFMMMNSLEPATLPDEGSPQLFQTGETFEGEPLIDRQHAHDFFMNLSATYRAEMERGGIWVIAAPVGEPALGPTAFMHRPSSGENPSAPLGHHWQDATHITYNVFTLGGEWRPVKVEVSVFHGAEPDEDRWDIDGGKIDSGSGRARVQLSRGWSAHVSHGFLNDPEALEEGDVRRTTVSLEYGADGNRPLSAMFLWGRNDQDIHDDSDALLAEAAWNGRPRDHFFGRAEYVEKDEFGLGNVKAFTAGYLRDIVIWNQIGAGAGADVTFYGYEDDLKSKYGSSPISTHLYVRVRWGFGTGMQHSGSSIFG
ncbi:MAG TPA: hypothetical protein VFR10_03450 [bacterium]|nr:hypothetical protein [bacterium]